MPRATREAAVGRIAILVDAGYLFAQGSIALTGAKRPRSTLKLNETAVMAELSSLARAKAGDADLLRVYWYDGAVNYKGPTLEQTGLAHLDNLKLRLGFINSVGQQKGVDSLIVTDLVDLARNHAISDAVLLSGDEDVRIGVQIAQNYGVRVHLLGIMPSQRSQSRNLQQEADTTTEWDQQTVAKFLSAVPISSPVSSQPTTAASATSPNNTGGPVTPTSTGLTPTITVLAQIEVVVDAYAGILLDTEVSKLKAHWSGVFGIPPEYDGKLIAKCRAEIGRDLALDERRHARARFKATVSAR